MLDGCPNAQATYDATHMMNVCASDCDLERRIDVADGCAFGPANHSDTRTTARAGDGAADAEVLHSAILNIAEETHHGLCRSQLEARNLVTHSVECPGEGMAAHANRCEVFHLAHVEVCGECCVGHAGCVGHYHGEEFQVIDRCELVGSVLHGKYEVCLAQFFGDGVGLCCRHESVFVGIPAVYSLEHPRLALLLSDEFDGDHVVYVVHQVLCGSCQADVSHAAGVNLTEDSRELANELQFLGSGERSGCSVYGLLELLLERLAEVGVLRKVAAGAPRECEDGASTSHAARDYLVERFAGFVGRAEVEDAHIAERQPRVGEPVAQIANAKGERAVCHLHCAEILVAAGSEGVGAGYHVVGHVAYDVFVDILYVAFEIRVHLIHCVLLRDDILSGRHHVDGILAQIELAGVEGGGEVFAGTEEAVQANHVDAVWHARDGLMEVEGRVVQTAGNAHDGGLTTRGNAAALELGVPAREALGEGGVLHQLGHLRAGNHAACNGVLEHLVYEGGLLGQLFDAEQARVRNIEVRALRILHARLYGLGQIGVEDLAGHAAYVVLLQVACRILAGVHILAVGLGRELDGVALRECLGVGLTEGFERLDGRPLGNRGSILVEQRLLCHGLLHEGRLVLHHSGHEAVERRFVLAVHTAEAVFCGIDNAMSGVERRIDIGSNGLEPSRGEERLSVELPCHFAAHQRITGHAQALGILHITGCARGAALEPVAGAEQRGRLAQTAHKGAAIRGRAFPGICDASHIQAVVQSLGRSVVQIAQDATSIAVGSAERDGAGVQTVLKPARIRVAADAAKAVVVRIVHGQRAAEAATVEVRLGEGLANDASRVRDTGSRGIDVQCRVHVCDVRLGSISYRTVSGSGAQEQAFDAEVANVGLHCVAEETCIAVRGLHVEARDTVALSVELACEGHCRAANGLQPRLRQVDVRCQHRLNGVAAGLHHLGEPDQRVLVRDFVASLSVLRLVVHIRRAAVRADAVCVVVAVLPDALVLVRVLHVFVRFIITVQTAVQIDRTPRSVGRRHRVHPNPLVPAHGRLVAIQLISNGTRGQVGSRDTLQQREVGLFALQAVAVRELEFCARTIAEDIHLLTLGMRHLGRCPAVGEDEVAVVEPSAQCARVCSLGVRLVCGHLAGRPAVTEDSRHRRAVSCSPSSAQEAANVVAATRHGSAVAHVLKRAGSVVTANEAHQLGASDAARAVEPEILQRYARARVEHTIVHARLVQ